MDREAGETERSQGEGSGVEERSRAGCKAPAALSYYGGPLELEARNLRELGDRSKNTDRGAR